MDYHPYIEPPIDVDFKAMERMFRHIKIALAEGNKFEASRVLCSVMAGFCLAHGDDPDNLLRMCSEAAYDMMHDYMVAVATAEATYEMNTH